MSAVPELPEHQEHPEPDPAEGSADSAGPAGSAAGDGSGPDRPQSLPATDDELERAKKPALEALEKATATNEYWLNGLAGAQADPRRLELLRSAEAGLERVSAVDVQKAAQTYLRGDTAWKLEIRPKAAVAAADPAPKPH